jgi:hypothetical protein
MISADADRFGLRTKIFSPAGREPFILPLFPLAGDNAISDAIQSPAL